MLSRSKVEQSLASTTAPCTDGHDIGPELADPVGTGLSDPLESAAPKAPTIQERAGALSGHVDKLRSERASLDKWNLNGEGRNQGLVHVVDYAHARPATSVKGKYGSLENTNLEDTIGRGAASGEDIREKLLAKGVAEKDFGKFASANLTPTRKDGGAGARVTRPKETDDEQTTASLADIDAAIAAAKKEMSDAINLVPGKDRGAWRTGAGAPFGKKIADLEQLALDRSMYTVPREDSKKGRVQTVERAMGAAPGAYAGNEINQVTGALDTLSTSVTPTTTTKDGSNTLNLGQQWGKAGPTATGGTAWTKQDTSIQDVSSSTSFTAGGPAQKVKAHKWGPSATTEKYSTVMGA